MKFLNEEAIKYKKGFRKELEDGTIIYIKRDQGRFRVEGTYGKNFSKSGELFFSPYFATLTGVKNFLKKQFNLELKE